MKTDTTIFEKEAQDLNNEIKQKQADGIDYTPQQISEKVIALATKHGKEEDDVWREFADVKNMTDKVRPDDYELENIAKKADELGEDLKSKSEQMFNIGTALKEPNLSWDDYEYHITEIYDAYEEAGREDEVQDIYDDFMERKYGER